MTPASTAVLSGHPAKVPRRSQHILMKLKRSFSFKRLRLVLQTARFWGKTMRVENQTRFNEWLLGSTILCQSCGCLWLVPAAQHEDRYTCRQCGSDVTNKATARRDTKNKTANTR